MAVRIQVRRDTFDNWAAANPVLASGEIGYITDRRMAKVGNGTAAFKDLEFLVGGSEAEMIALINRNTASITEEAQTRASADATLQSAISAESAARSEGDNVLNGRVQALENAEPDVPAGLVEQVDANTESIIGLVQNDENLTEALNGKLGLPQGELTELNQNDWLIIGRTDPNTGTTPTYLSRLSTLAEEIGGGEPPEPTTVLNWDFAGVTFFQAPPTGGIGVNPSGTTIYVSKTNAAGNDISTEFLNEFRAGNLFSLQVPARTNGDTGDTTQYMQFVISQTPVNQGNWWNVATQRIINANSQNEWAVGQSLDIVVAVAPQTRFLLTDPEEQPEDIITDPDLLQHWTEYKERQGWEEGYIPTQQDVNRYFNEIDQVQQATLRDTNTRLEKLEEGTEPPTENGFGVYNFAGETWWGQPDAGELWMNFGENQFFMSATDASGKNLKTFYEGMVKGQSIAIQGPNGFARFLLKAEPSFGSSMNGDYFTIAVREEYVQGGMEVGDRLVLILEENTKGNYGFEASTSVDPIVELTEMVGKMKKEITSLKTSLTKIRKSVNGSD